MLIGTRGCCQIKSRFSVPVLKGLPVAVGVKISQFGASGISHSPIKQLKCPLFCRVQNPLTGGKGFVNDFSVIIQKADGYGVSPGKYFSS